MTGNKTTKNLLKSLQVTDKPPINKKLYSTLIGSKFTLTEYSGLVINDANKIYYEHFGKQDHPLAKFQSTSNNYVINTSDPQRRVLGVFPWSYETGKNALKKTLNYFNNKSNKVPANTSNLNPNNYTKLAYSNNDKSSIKKLWNNISKPKVSIAKLRQK